MMETTAAQRRAVEMMLELCARPGRAVVDAHLARGDVDWGHLLYFADINGVMGFLWAAADGLDDSRIPWRVLVRLSQWTASQRQRRESHTGLVDELAAAGVAAAPPILLKGGAFLQTIYAGEPELRGIGDIDLLVSPEDVAPLQGWITRRGFRCRDTKNGFTAFNDHPDAGLRMVLDVHCGDPTKSGRRPEAVHALFRHDATQEVGGGRLRVPSPELSLVFACRHFCEHEEDFRKVLNQDDLRIFRLVDVLRLAPLCDAARLHALAAELGWLEPLGRCLRYVHLLFGRAAPDPAWYRPEPAHLATPLGALAWPWPIAERIRRVDRAEWVAGEMGPRGGRSDWYTAKGGAQGPSAVALPGAIVAAPVPASADAGSTVGSHAAAAAGVGA
jgi:Uncharacterised nucleotidyltransferase